MSKYDMVKEFFERRIPFNKLLGVRVLDVQEGTCMLAVAFSPSLIGDPDRPALHGGVMSAVLDAAGGLAAWSMYPFANVRVSTVDLRVDYLRPGLPEDLTFEAKVLRRGNRVAVVSMQALQREGTYLTAEGRGVYNVVRRDENSR